MKLEVAPALGCTEPAAIALCSAAAAHLVTRDEISQIEVWLDPNLYKNAMGVAIPSADGGYGVDLAAAMGVFGGDPTQKLEIFNAISEDAVKKAKKLVIDGGVNINLMEKQQGLYIRVKITAGENTAEAIIQNYHDNIVSLSLNDVPVSDHHLVKVSRDEQSAVQKLEGWLKELTLEKLIGLLDSLDDEDLKFIEKGISYNTALAEYGMSKGCGLGIGLTINRLIAEGMLKRDIMLDASMLTAAAADARMSGAKLPAMSSAGSGNHGLMAILPIWAAKDYVTCDDTRKVLKAIALSHIITAYMKSYTGRLSAVCGCSIAAGAGAAAGITYLLNGDRTHIAGAIKNLIGDLAGVICDGAKNSCSLKLATAARTAVQSALFSLHGVTVSDTDGIISPTAEQTIKNVGDLSTQGMIEADRTILKIMISKKLSEA